MVAAPAVASARPVVVSLNSGVAAAPGEAAVAAFMLSGSVVFGSALPVCRILMIRIRVRWSVSVCGRMREGRRSVVVGLDVG